MKWTFKNTNDYFHAIHHEGVVVSANVSKQILQNGFAVADALLSIVHILGMGSSNRCV